MDPKDVKNDGGTSQPGQGASPAPDYKAEYEKALKEKQEREEQLKKAEFTIEKLKSSESPAVDIEKLKQEIAEGFKKEIDTIKTTVTASIFEDEILRLSSNPDEAKLIRFHYENSIAKSGYDRSSIQKDLNNARTLANKPKTDAKIEEVKKSFVSGATMGSSGGSGQQPEKRFDDGKYSAQELQWAQTAAQRTGVPVEKILAKLDANKNRGR